MYKLLLKLTTANSTVAITRYTKRVRATGVTHFT